MVREGNSKTAEELVFLTPATRYTLKSSILNCKSTQVFVAETKNGFRKDSHARIQHFTSNC
jgi:hypothetical protein